MFGPLGVHGVGLFFVKPHIDAWRMPDGKWCRGLGGDTAARVHLLRCQHLHGLIRRAARGQQGRAAGQRGPPGPAVPSYKLHWTVEGGHAEIIPLSPWLKVTEASSLKDVKAKDKVLWSLEWTGVLLVSRHPDMSSSISFICLTSRCSTFISTV